MPANRMNRDEFYAAMAAHDNQAASVWIMRSDAEWNDRSFPANMRLRLTERGLVPLSAPQ